WVKVACTAAGKIIADISAHANDPEAHHDIYTDDDARGSINDALLSTGRLSADLHCNWKGLAELDSFRFRYAAGQLNRCDIVMKALEPEIRFKFAETDVGNVDGVISVFDGTVYQPLIRADTFAAAYSAMMGTQYWSCPGGHFGSRSPDTDQLFKDTVGSIIVEADGIYFNASVNLPDGATVTGVIIYGNAAAKA
ncbi:unnamed protein product, partial [marine sediment metagenome]